MSEDIVKKKHVDSRKFFELLDEAYFLIRDNKFELLPLYLIGSVPFIAGLMLFIYQLGHRRADDVDIVVWAMILTVLFCWKNLFFCLFNDAMMRVLSGDSPRLSMRQLATSGARLTILLAWCLVIFCLTIAFPLTLVVLFPLMFLVIPLYWATAGVVCATDVESGIFSIIKKIFIHLGRRPVHAVAGAFILLLIMLIVFLNLMGMTLIIPAILKTFFNLDTAFSHVSDISTLVGLIFNSTIFSIVIGVAWLMLEPLYTSYCMLRVFYGESKLKGLDLKAKVLRFSRNVLLIVAIFFSGAVVSASNTPENKSVTVKKKTARKLEDDIKHTLKKSEFQWRDESVPVKNTKESWIWHYVRKAMDYVGEKLKGFFKWLKKVFKKIIPDFDLPDYSGPGAAWLILWEVGKFVLLFLVLAAVIVFLYRYIKKRKESGLIGAGTSLISLPDLNDDELRADVLEQGEWLKLGSDLLEQGQYRLALRAFYLGCICALADRCLLNVAIGKSDYEYFAELKRRGHSEPELITGFGEAIKVFQRVWYGDYPAEPDMAIGLKRQAEAFASSDDKASGDSDET